MRKISSAKNEIRLPGHGVDDLEVVALGPPDRGGLVVTAAVDRQDPGLVEVLEAVGRGGVGHVVRDTHDGVGCWFWSED